MNKDLLSYKSRFITIILLLGYALLHIKLTGYYVDATLDKLLAFSARLPFGQRFLVPAIAHGLAFVLPLKAQELFLITELIMISLFYIVLIKLLGQAFNAKQSQVLGWLFLLLLPLATVVNYRFTINGEATVYYPYDSATLFFMTAGFLLCLRAQWRYFIPLVFLATFNRESSLLLVLIIPALHWQKLRAAITPMLLSLVAYLLARIIILLLVQDLPGNVFELYYRTSGHTHYEVNLMWLFEDENILLFYFCFAGLPLFWFGFYDYMPVQYRPLRYVMLFYFLVLLLVGNFMEARIFIEIVALLYFPICVAISRWLQGCSPFLPSATGALYYLDRYLILGVLALTVLLRNLINPVILLFANPI